MRGSSAEQLDKKVDKRRLGGVADDVPPAMDVEDNVGVRDVQSRLGFEPVAAEGKEIYGDALWRFERVAGEEGVRVRGRRGDLYADSDIRWEGPRIRVSSALIQGRGGAEWHPSSATEPGTHCGQRVPLFIRQWHDGDTGDTGAPGVLGERVPYLLRFGNDSHQVKRYQ